MSVADYKKYREFKGENAVSEPAWLRTKAISFANLGLTEFDFSMVPPEIECLNLSGNNFTTLTIPKELENLEAVLLDNCQLVELKCSGTLPKLRYLTAKNNRLSSLDASNMPQIGRVYLDNNKLTELSFGLLGGFNLSVVSVKNNPSVTITGGSSRRVVFS